MQYMGRLNGARLFSDYAHHPTELRATLEGLREAAEGRVVAVFQPHTYSRTATLFDEFAHSFGASDEVIITDIYAARETNTYGVSEGALASAIGEKALYIKGFEAVAEHLAKTVTESDTVILLGAGDVEKVLEHLPALDK
jgi:UDP-N-acetylmuramate--alanine ligase